MTAATRLDETTKAEVNRISMLLLCVGGREGGLNDEKRKERGSRARWSFALSFSSPTARLPWSGSIHLPDLPRHGTPPATFPNPERPINHRESALRRCCLRTTSGQPRLVPRRRPPPRPVAQAAAQLGAQSSDQRHRHPGLVSRLRIPRASPSTSRLTDSSAPTS